MSVFCLFVVFISVCVVSTTSEDPQCFAFKALCLITSDKQDSQRFWERREERSKEGGIEGRKGRGRAGGVKSRSDKPPVSRHICHLMIV